MKLFLFALFLCVFCEDEEILVDVEEGLLEGIIEKNNKGNDIYAWLSVPYAKPPIGDLRFANPEPSDAWEDVREATKMPDYCLQCYLDVNGSNPIVGKEDCLYLNIYRAKNMKTRKLPVMVFIHGGSFFFSGAKDYNYKHILDYDVLLVTIQYRLGILGFLSTNDKLLSGNYGLKDQQMALQWIKKNIAKFRGDPDNITLFGESAGAASIHYHILAKSSAGLFNKAIMMSGTAISPWAQSDQHLIFANHVAQKVDCGGEEILNCLRKTDAHKLVQVFGDFLEYMHIPNYMLPRVDGVFLTESPEELMEKKTYNKVDMIFGITRDEGAILLANMKTDESIDLSQYLTILPLLLYLDKESDKPSLEKILHQYFHKRNMDHNNLSQYDNTLILDNFVEMFGDRYFNYPNYKSLLSMGNDTDVSVYAYNIHYKTSSPSQDLLSGIPHKYIPHGEDLRLIFSGGAAFPLELVDSDDIYMKRILLTVLTDFARTGYPTPREKYGFMWPTIASSGKQLIFKKMPYIEDIPNKVKETINFFSTLDETLNDDIKSTKFVNDEL